MSRLIIFLNICLIKFYQYFISPIFTNKCRYFPSCSEYYIQSLKMHGFIKGSYLGLKRILSCHPFKILGGGTDFDFIPNQNQINKEKNNG